MRGCIDTKTPSSNQIMPSMADERQCKAVHRMIMRMRYEKCESSQKLHIHNTLCECVRAVKQISKPYFFRNSGVFCWWRQKFLVQFIKIATFVYIIIFNNLHSSSVLVLHWTVQNDSFRARKSIKIILCLSFSVCVSADSLFGGRIINSNVFA